MNALALYQPSAFVRPSGIAQGDAADLLAGAWGRFGTSAQTSVDQQIQRQANVALDQVQARVPALAATISQTAATAIEQGRVAATRAAHDAAADALRQASAALIAAQPSLEAAIRRIAAQSGGAAADAGFTAVMTRAAPWLLGVLLIGGVVYVATDTRRG